jgi:hypothetical protein
MGWVGAAPGVEPQNVYVWGACNASVCWWSQAAAALDAARFAYVRVAVIDFWGTQYNLGLANAVAAAWNYDSAGTAVGMTLLAPAGWYRPNSQQPPGPVYPALYDHVLGVSGIKPDSSFAHSSICLGGDFASNYGSHVDLAGGFWGWNAWGNNGFTQVCGSTVGASYVAGVAALVRARNPSRNTVWVADALTKTAHDLGTAGWDDHFGNGLVDAPAAMSYVSVLNVSIDGPDEVRPNVDCSWYADVSGGSPPYTYQWYQNWMGAGTDPWVDLYTGYTGFVIRLYAWGADGSQGYGQLFVTNTSSAPICIY